MFLLRWTRRALDGLLLAAIVGVVAIAAVTVAGQVLGGRALVLAGGSMEPSMPRGSYVLSLPVPADQYQIGDVVTVAAPGLTPYTHRITRLVQLPGGLHVETKGDANPAPEPVVTPVTVLAGRVAFFVPGLGFLAMILASPLGLFGFLMVCGTILACIWLIEELELRDCPACAAVRAAPPAAVPATADAATALPPAPGEAGLAVDAVPTMADAA